MQEGIFTLSKTIANPKPDRRTRNRWLGAAEWKAGTVFSVMRAPSHPGDAPYFRLKHLDERYPEEVSFFHNREGGFWRSSHPDQEAALLTLVAALAPSTDPDHPLLWLILKRHDYISRASEAVLFRLVREGAVTLAQVEAALDASDAEDDGALSDDCNRRLDKELT